jgi:hypothetical protein
MPLADIGLPHRSVMGRPDQWPSVPACGLPPSTTGQIGRPAVKHSFRREPRAFTPRPRGLRRGGGSAAAGVASAAVGRACRGPLRLSAHPVPAAGLRPSAPGRWRRAARHHQLLRKARRQPPTQPGRPPPAQPGRPPPAAEGGRQAPLAGGARRRLPFRRRRRRRSRRPIVSGRRRPCRGGRGGVRAADEQEQQGHRLGWGGGGRGRG